MLKKTGIVIVCLLILATPSVYAIEESTNSAIPAGMMRETGAVKIQQSASDKVTVKKTFKEQMQGIRDIKKKATAERINTKISTANSTLTSKMQTTLDRLSEFVNTISSKGAALKAGGANTTALEASLVAAQNSIQTAQLAVTTQKAKTYSAEVTDDTTLKNDIGKMVSSFRTDISETHTTVMDAKKAVMASMRELMKLSPEKTNTATPGSVMRGVQ